MYKAGSTITPLFLACGQQEETLEHLWYECHRQYETERQRVCEELNNVLTGWIDMLDAMRRNGIAPVKETVQRWQRERESEREKTKGPTRPAYDETIEKLRGAAGIQGDVERHDVSQQEETQGSKTAGWTRRSLLQYRSTRADGCLLESRGRPQTNQRAEIEAILAAMRTIRDTMRR